MKQLVGKVNKEVIQIQDVDCEALIDSGSVISSVSYDFFLQHLSNINLQPIESVFEDGITITSATGDKLNIVGFIEVKVLLPGLFTLSIFS